MMKKFGIVVLLACSVVACSTQTVLISGNGGVLKSEESQTFFIGGIGQTQAVDAAEICGGANKVIKVERVDTVGNIALRYLTFGIYTPHKAKVYCDK